MVKGKKAHSHNRGCGMTFARRLCGCVFGIVAGVMFVSKGMGSEIGAYALRGVVAAPSAGAFMDMFDVTPDGRTVVLASNDVYVERRPGARRFHRLGALTGAGAPIEFPAFIRVSPDGTKFAVGNNAEAVGVFTFEGLTGVWYALPHFDATWLDDDHLAIRAGGQVTLLDTTSDPDDPRLDLLIDNGPIAAGITFDATGNLYTGTGLTSGGPSETGWVKVFSVDRWQDARDNGNVIDYESEGTLIVDVLSASSLGFDDQGNLHVGGGDLDTGDLDNLALVSAEAVRRAIAGGGPADVDDPEQVRRFDPDPDNTFNWYDAVYNTALSELTIRDAWTSRLFIYTGPSEVACDDVRRITARCNDRGRIRATLRLHDAAHDGQTVYVAIDGVPLRLVIHGHRAKASLGRQSAGEHVVSVKSPADCGLETTVECR